MGVGARLLEVLERGERAVLLTVLEGEDRGARLLVLAGGETIGEAPAGLAELAAQIERNGVVEHEGQTIYAELYGPPPRLIVVGAVDTAEALCAVARLAGWRTIVVDARAQFATPERLPSADDILVSWPEEALATIEPDRQTAVVILAHDDKFDLPALQAALAGPAFYVGAIGSRRTQSRRGERLVEAGVAEADVARIHGPAGLDLGADSPSETGLAILAEILAVRAGRDGRPLRDSSQRIHVE
ncbi:MAG: XdhC family protein [Gaiellaceae bacterium]